MMETAQREGMVEVEAARYEQTLPTPSPSIRPVKTAGTQRQTTVMDDSTTTPRGMIDRLLASHSVDQTTRTSRTRSQQMSKTPEDSTRQRSKRDRSTLEEDTLTKDGGGKRRRSMPLVSKETDSTTPRTMIEGFMQDHATAQQSVKKKSRIVPSPNASDRSFKSPNKSLNRTSASLRKKATMRHFIKQQTVPTEGPTPRAMIHGFLSEAQEETPVASQRNAKLEESIMPSLSQASDREQSDREQDSIDGDSFLDAYLKASSQPTRISMSQPPVSPRLIADKRQRAILAIRELGGAMEQTMSQEEEEEEVQQDDSSNKGSIRSYKAKHKLSKPTPEKLRSLKALAGLSTSVILSPKIADRHTELTSSPSSPMDSPRRSSRRISAQKPIKHATQEAQINDEELSEPPSGSVVKSPLSSKLHTERETSTIDSSRRSSRTISPEKLIERLTHDAENDEELSEPLSSSVLRSPHTSVSTAELSTPQRSFASLSRKVKKQSSDVSVQDVFSVSPKDRNRRVQRSSEKLADISASGSESLSADPQTLDSASQKSVSATKSGRRSLVNRSLNRNSSPRGSNVMAGKRRSRRLESEAGSFVEPSDDEERSWVGELASSGGASGAVERREMMVELVDESHLEISQGKIGNVPAESSTIGGDAMVVSIMPISSYNMSTVEAGDGRGMDEGDVSGGEDTVEGYGGREDEDVDASEEEDGTATNQRSIHQQNDEEDEEDDEDDDDDDDNDDDNETRNTPESLQRRLYDTLRTPVLSQTAANQSSRPTPYQRLMQQHKPSPKSKQMAKETEQAGVSGPPRAAPPRRKRRPSSGPPALPSSLAKSIFTHFLGGSNITKDTLMEVEKASNTYWKNVSRDLEAYTSHARRTTVEESDMALLMQRQRFVKENRSMYRLVEDHLPLQYQREIIPCASAGNVVTPKV